MVTKYLVSSDISKVEVDAIVTLINSEGDWQGGVDHAIRHVAGMMYHAVPSFTLFCMGGLRDRQVVVARGDRNQHRGKFNDVIFVVDDLKRPLGELVTIALLEAKKRGYKSIALPVMRTGVMLGQVEPDVSSVIAQMVGAIDRFAKIKVKMDIYVVVYKDDYAYKKLHQELKPDYS